MSGRNRGRRAAALGLAAALAASAAQAQLDWRFGIEDAWSQLGGLLTPAQKDGLARKMAAAVAPQPAGGDVNVNGLAGGWAEMQPGPGQAVRFAKSDALVRLLDRTARHLVKAFVSAFGEGAERVSSSGNADYVVDRLVGLTGWLNLLGSFGEVFPEQPAFHAYRQLVEKLHDFTAVEELRVSADPRTRVYRFARPRGPLFVAWSETGPAPPALDYRIANGETVDIPVGGERVGSTRFLATTRNRRAEIAALAAPGGTLRLRLGYEPVFLEPAPAAGCAPDAEHLCLAGGRFRAGVRWRTPAGESGAGQAAAITTDTGSFSFFDPDNLEVVVKVLDACAFARFWVFATGLTDVGTTLEVEDVVSGARRAYFTAPGQSFPPLQDTDAFPTCD